MLAGHYVTAVIANQKMPGRSLLFFLVACQAQDLLWMTFHYLGLESTEPSDALDTTISGLAVDMMYSHDLLPQALWATLFLVLGSAMFKDVKVGLMGAALVAGHAALDAISGFPHHVFGEDSHPVGLGLYASRPYLAVFIEAVFVVVAGWYYFDQQARAGVQHTPLQKWSIIGILTYAMVFMAFTATVSLREWFGIPEFDVGFNTSVPTLIFTYLSMMLVLFLATPRTR
ncbi:MAG: hypothetical protein AAF830_06940 [Pseudomonadota bacterium]